MEKVNFLEFGSGEPLLILEGWATNTSLYSALAEHIAKLGYRVLLPDLPGFGATPEPEHSWNTADYAEFVNRFLEKLGISRVTLLGHSHGGRVIIKALGENLLTVEVPRIILMDSAGIRGERRKPPMSYRIARTILKLFPSTLERYRGSRGSADYRNATPVMRETLVKLVNEDMRGLLPNINVPALLIWGENDADTPLANGILMESLLPNAGLVQIPGAGHYAHLDNPEFVCRVIDNFLTGKT